MSDITTQVNKNMVQPGIIYTLYIHHCFCIFFEYLTDRLSSEQLFNKSLEI